MPLRFFRARVDRVEDPRQSPSYQVRPGLGPPGPLCDCDSPGGDLIDRSNFVTQLVSAQYLVLLCAKYCLKLGRRKRPYSSSHAHEHAHNSVERPEERFSFAAPTVFRTTTTTTSATTTTSPTTTTTTTTEMSLFQKYLSTFNFLQKLSAANRPAQPRMDNGDDGGDLSLFGNGLGGDVEDVEDVEESRSNRVKKSRGK